MTLFFFFKFASVKQTVIEVMKTITKVARCWNSNDAYTKDKDILNL